MAPTKEILDSYKNKKINWDEYNLLYIKLLENRHIVDKFKKVYKDMDTVCFLCSEPSAANCHRGILADYLYQHLDNISEVIHL